MRVYSDLILNHTPYHLDLFNYSVTLVSAVINKESQDRLHGQFYYSRH